MPLTADASFAAIRARSRFGIAIAAIIRMPGIAPTPTYPSTNPAIATPSPLIRPALLRISERLKWPKTMARMARGKTKKKIPLIRLTIALPLVSGGVDGGAPATATAVPLEAGLPQTRQNLSSGLILLPQPAHNGLIYSFL